MIKSGTLCAVLLSAGLLLGSVASASQFETVQVPFESAVGEKPPITLSFEGKLYKKRYEFARLKKHLNSLTPEERFIISVIDANREGDKAKMLKLWRPAERGEMQGRINDPDLYEKNTALYRNVLASRFIAMLRYGNFTLVYVEHELQGVGPYVKLYPIVWGKDGFFLSNALSGNFFYENFAFQLGQHLRSTVK